MAEQTQTREIITGCRHYIENEKPERVLGNQPTSLCLLTGNICVGKNYTSDPARQDVIERCPAYNPSSLPANWYENTIWSELRKHVFRVGVSRIFEKYARTDDCTKLVALLAQRIDELAEFDKRGKR
jgi:hypothetical protein